MKWKRLSNFIIAIILSFAFIIVTLLNIIGPMHINATGGINSPVSLAFYSIVYLIAALVTIWSLYFYLRKKPELLFFGLILMGIIVIIVENFLWGWVGS